MSSPRVALLLALGIALRVSGLGVHSLWFDEGATLLVAKAADLELLALDRHPPLSFLLFRGWIAVVGEGDAALRLLPALVSSASLVLFARLAGHWASGAARLGAIALYAVSPFHVWHAQEVRMYAFVELGSVVALLGAAGFLVRRRWTDLAHVALGTALAFGSHYYGGLVVAAIAAVAAVAVRCRSASVRAAALLVSAAAIGLAAWLPWLLSYLPAQAATRWHGHKQRGLWDLLRLPARHFLVSMDGLPSGAQALAPLLWFVLLLAFAVQAVRALAAWRTRRAEDLWGIVTWAAPTAGAFALTFVTVPLFLPKYMIAGAPGAVLAIATGLTSLRPTAVRRAALAVACLGGLAVTLLHRLENQRDDYRGACNEVVRTWRPGEPVVTTGAFPAFTAATVRHYLRDRADILTEVGGVATIDELRRAAQLARTHVIHRHANPPDAQIAVMQRALPRLQVVSRLRQVAYLVVERP